MPLPSPPQWVESGLAVLLGRDIPPKHYSGASLQVQRQQRMDEVENMLQQLQQRQVRGSIHFENGVLCASLFQVVRNVRIGAPVPAQPVQPQAAHVSFVISL